MSENQERELVERLCKRIEKDVPIFSLNCPASLTQRRPNDELGNSFTYGHKSFIGEEVFHLYSCYIGKRGTMIFVFGETAETAIKTESGIEIPIKKANDILDGFSGYLQDILNEDYDSVMADARKHAKKAEEQIHAETIAKRLASPELKHYGSW